MSRANTDDRTAFKFEADAYPRSFALFGWLKRTIVDQAYEFVLDTDVQRHDDIYWN